MMVKVKVYGFSQWLNDSDPGNIFSLIGQSRHPHDMITRWSRSPKPWKVVP